MYHINGMKTSNTESGYFVKDINAEKMHSPVFKESYTAALHGAAKDNQVDLLNFLLDTGHDINAKDKMGLTPLMLAVNSNSFDTIQLLLDRNADVFVTDSANRSIFEMILLKSSCLPRSIVARVLSMLMKLKIDSVVKVNILVKAKCQLKMVLLLKDAQVTREFLERAHSCTNEECIFAIDYAVGRLDLETLYVLLHYGPGIDVRRDLFFCDKLIAFLNIEARRNLQAAQILLDRLDSWDLINEDSIQHFYLLFGIGSLDTLQLLLQCQIDAHFRNKVGQDLIAHIFDNPSIDAIDLLQYRQFDVNAQGENGWSALHFAVKANSKKNVLYLLNYGAYIDIKNHRGRTPLFEAVACASTDMVLLLLQHGADIAAVVHKEFSVFDPFCKSVSSVIQEFVLAHLVLEKELGRAIEASIKKRIYSNKKCKEIYDRCCRHISRLKSAKVEGSFTLFTAVAGKVEDIALVVQDDQKAEYLKDYSKSLHIFRYYHLLLNHKLTKAVNINLKLKQEIKYNLTFTISQSNGPFADFETLTTDDVDMLPVY